MGLCGAEVRVEREDAPVSSAAGFPVPEEAQFLDVTCGPRRTVAFADRSWAGGWPPSCRLLAAVAGRGAELSDNEHKLFYRHLHDTVFEGHHLPGVHQLPKKTSTTKRTGLGPLDEDQPAKMVLVLL